MKGFSSKERKIKIAKSIAASLAVGISIFYITPQAYANTAPANTTLPSGGTPMAGVDIGDPINNVMNINQHDFQDAYIKWGDFSIGANATVNFSGNKNNYNMLNYVTGSSASQIYGRMNANNNGHIYVVNPNGVQIGKSAQINVGSLYVSNQNLDKVDFNNKTVQNIINNQNALRTNAELMSLGNINATSVKFVGNRVVLDTDRVTGKAEVNSGNKDVVLGYTKDSYQNNTTITGVDNLDEYKYQWVKNLQDLQNMKDNTSINYALNNSIDAIPTKDINFESIQDFRGKFDGLNNNIFGLTINRSDENNVGLFGSTNGATIKNVQLVNGSITGGTNVGAVVGNAKNTTIENVVSSAQVTGEENIGGIAGNADGTALADVINTGTVEGYANVGGLAGSMADADVANEFRSEIKGNSYNLGAIHGLKEDLSAETTDFTGKTEDEVKTLLAGNKSHNIGGLVGSASNTTLGDGTTQIFNGMSVQGGYNVGGIVGSMESSTVHNAANNADITATGYTSEAYKYHGNESGSYNGEKFHTDVDADGNLIDRTIDGVNAANVGGIAGTASSSEIKQVINTGDIETAQFTKGSGSSSYEVYAGGNVGGIAGRLNNTNIDDAENKENKIFASHNVGGVAGYVEGGSTISNAVNNGGEVLGTGALTGLNFAEEVVVDNRDKKNHIGNIGGIAGYMYGNDTHIMNSANRGFIHTLNETSTEGQFKENSKAGNIGGVVGKIDRTKTLGKGDLGEGYAQAAVSNSYNTGDIKGYLNVGGIAGMMYNGEVAGSYNSGSINTTKGEASYDTLNMGGIVGETTEGTHAKALLYDVYNRGDIGDKSFTYGSRHVGGVVGRLSGTVENSYNKGNIYNNSVATGGVAGWMTKGSVKNSFNAGNITVLNKDNGDYSAVGGIVGGTGQHGSNFPADDQRLDIENVYNLGVLRNFADTAKGAARDSIGGIVGVVSYNTKALNISNVYTTGEMYLQHEDNNGHIGSIYGSVQNGGKHPTITNAYYIKPQDNSGFTAVNDNQAVKIDYGARHEAGSYSGLFENDEDMGGIKGDWRIYGGTTPILNAFLPKLAEGDNLTSKTENVNVNNVQFGNAYNPFATIIDADGKEIKIDDSGAGAIGNVDSVIVRNGSLTVNNAANTGNTMYNGTLYADGAMILNGAEGANISLGSISNLYGSTVTVNSDGNLKAYGNIISTGANGKDNSVNINTTNGGNIEILGTVKSAAKGETITIDGMDNSADGKTVTENDVKDPNAVMPEVGQQYSFTTNKASANGKIEISAKDKDGNAGKVDILYGNLGKGYINSSGSVNITGSEVYMDSDLNIGGDLTINADTSVLDISNVGKTKAAEKGGTQKDYLHGEENFLSHFTNGNSINFNTTAGKEGNVDAMIAVDMWDYEKGQFDLTKFDAPDNSHLFTNDLTNLNLNGKNEKGDALTGRNTTYIWVGSGEQLAGIQQYKDGKPDSGILSFSFALKNDIDASQIGSDYKSIGTIDKDGNGTAFTGVFDGRGNRIIGLDTVNNANDSNALFGTIGDDKGNGTVKDIKVYSFTVEDDGVIANTNNGTIDGISAFGNAVSGTGNVGGIVGTNSGTIQNTTSASVVVNTSADSKDSPVSIGGIAGTNAGTITNTESNSAVTSDTSLGEKSALGGIAGSNSGTIENVVSKGVTTGLYNNNADGDYSSFKTAGNVGGIAGINTNAVNSAYNESIVSGMKNVGGVVGSNSGTINNLANATNVYGGDNVGGIAGSNDGTLTNGRNNGEIFGGKNITDENGSKSGGTNVGGLVGVSGENSSMSNLTNDMSASITGHTNVGGLIGLNKGTLTDGQNLMNKGVISGVSNVGGSIGENAGIVANVNNVNTADIVKNDAYANGANADESDKKYENFGGVIGHNAKAGQNDPTGGTYSKDGIVYNVSNNMDVTIQNADDVKYIGGIIGSNDGVVLGKLVNGGYVTGNENVGGVIGQNNAVIDSTKVSEDVINTIKTALGENSIDDNKAEVSLINGAVVDYDEGTGKADYSKIEIEKDEKGNLIKNTVSGKTNVGGVIGSNNNSADISHTNVVNTVAGIVMGTDNIGGLFGTNSGIVTGGRDDKGNYYKYHIVNNGTVTGTDTNAGGLVGINTGSLTAGYNTGSVIGNNSVGGIAGRNDGGTIELVFSNVENGNKVNGNQYAGGVVGYNHGGTLRNAYSIGAVGQYDNVLNVIGNDSSDETTTFSYRSEKEAAEKANVSGSAWKLQNGLAGPMLKVFLTKLVYHEKNGAVADFPYDGNLHGFTIVINKDKNIAEVHKDGEMIGYLAAADGSGVHSLKDYFDTVGSGSDLISSNSQSEVGEYEMFFSHQINTSKADTPNKLGYEFVQGSSYDPGNPDDPKNPGGNNFNPDDPTPGTDTPEYEIIDNPGWENGRWEYLFDDNPWGRKRNFRERKAEFNYQQGGTEIDEADEEEADAELEAEA